MTAAQERTRTRGRGRTGERTGDRVREFALGRTPGRAPTLPVSAPVVMPERSMRRVDPLGTLASRPLTLFSAIAAPVMALTLTLLRWGDVDSPWLMAAALAALGASCGLLVVSSDTLRAPFSGRAQAGVVLLAWLAALLEMIAHWQGNEFIRDDWGQLGIGIVLVAISPYRPVRSLMVWAVGSAVFVAVLALVRSHTLVTEMPPVSFAIVATAPVLALALAGMAYTQAAVHSRERWLACGPGAGGYVGASAGGATSPNRLDYAPFMAEPGDHDLGVHDLIFRDPISRHPLTRSAQLARVGVLNGEVVPFLESILARGTVTADDAATAARISREVRTIMVAEAKRSWLGNAVAESALRALTQATPPGLQPRGPLAVLVTGGAVRDESRFSDAMSFQQRAAVRAMLEAAVGETSFVAEDFAAQVYFADGRARVRIVAGFAASGRPRALRGLLRGSLHGALRRRLRRSLGPALAMMRVLFPQLDVDVISSNCSLTLTLRFSYGH